MTTAPTIELRTFTDLELIPGDVIDVYAEVRAPLLHLPNYAVTAFGERLDRHRADLRCISYYGNRIEHGDRHRQHTAQNRPRSTPAAQRWP